MDALKLERDALLAQISELRTFLAIVTGGVPEPAPTAPVAASDSSAPAPAPTVPPAADQPTQS